MKNNRSQRITLYITEEKRDRARRLKEAFLEEGNYFPTVSTNAWLNLILDAGLDALTVKCRHAQEG